MEKRELNEAYNELSEKLKNIRRSLWLRKQKRNL